jgi:TonB family protein
MAHTLDEFLTAARTDLAYTDDLTGLFNARLLSAVFQSWWAELLAAHETLTLIIIDLDGFKDVNDRYGHLTGNEVLKATAEVLSRHFRSDDIVVRYGGDEFVIVLPGAGRTAADRLAERAREALAGSHFACVETGQPVDVTVSFSLGAATFPDDGKEGEALLQRADQLLLADKSERRPPRTPAPQGPRWAALTAVAAVAALAAVATFVVVTRSRPPALDPATPTLERQPTPGLPSSREEELLAQIATLEAQVHGLTEEMDRQSADRQRQYQSEIASLVTQIRELQVEARDERSRAAGEATPLPVTPQPTARPVVIRPTPTAVPPPTAAPEERPTSPPQTAAARPLVVPPVLTWIAEPRYPDMARRFNMEATVEMRVLVGTDGQVKRAEPVGDSVGYGFDQAAREAAFKARYRPATRDGVPIEMETDLTVTFRLGESPGG